MSKSDINPKQNDNPEDILFNINALTQTDKSEFIPDLLLPDEDEAEGVSGTVRLGVSVKQKRRRIKVRIAAILIPLIIFSVIPAYIYVYKPIYAERYYGKITYAYNTLSAGAMPSDYLQKFGGLYDINSDIGGWITVPNSKINYPVLFSGNKDPGYYETHLFNKLPNKYGSIYFKNVFSRESYVKNTVVCANENFFGELAGYFDVWHYKKSPIILMDTVYSEDYWKIFAVLKIENNDTVFDPEKINFTDDADFSQHINTALSQSYIDNNIDILTNDRILTVICYFDGYRVAVLSRRVRAGESAAVDTGGAKAHIPGDIAENAIITPFKTDESDTVESEVIAFEPSESSLPPDENSALPAMEISNSRIKSESAYSSVSQTDDVSQAQSGSVSPAPASSSAVSTHPMDVGQLTVRNSATGEVVTDDAVNIIAAIVEAEVGGFAQTEVLKAQAVASYTFLLYNKTSASSPVPVIMKTPRQDAIDAARAVAGQAVVYYDKLCSTHYFAVSAGKTTSCQDTWGSNIPYLVSVDSSVERNLSNYMTKVVYSSAQIKERAQSKLGITLSGDPSTWLAITSHDSGGEYVTGVSVGGNTTYTNSSGKKVLISGRTISEVMLSYGLRSHAFEIEYNASADQFTFTVYGSGHGVGMSQYDANEYAKQGYDYIWILEHYYTGTSVQYITEY